MATRTFQFFTRLPEFLDIINPIIKSLNLEVFFYKIFNEQIELTFIEKPITINEFNKFIPDIIYLSQDKTPIQSIDPKEVIPAQLGWVQIDLPKEENSILFMSEIGVKTDWYDEKDIHYENKELINLYNRITSRLRRKFNSSVKAYNIHEPELITTYRGIGFANSAKVFFLNGGELMQNGVNNVRFVIEDTK